MPRDVKRGFIEAAWLGRAECRSCGVRDLVLFADLRDEDFQLIHLPIEEMVFEAGSALCRAGDDGNAVFTLRSGLVKLVQYLPDGTQRIVRLLREGALIGLEALAGQPYHHAAIAVQAVQACRIPREVVDRLNRETPRLYRQLMAKWQAALTQADECLIALNTGTARQRVARLFLLLCDHPCSGVCQFLRREDVGAILSVSMETACRVVAEMKRAGVVAEIGPNLFQCDHAALEAIAREG